MSSGVYFSSTSIMLLKASNEFRSLLQFYICNVTEGSNEFRSLLQFYIYDVIEGSNEFRSLLQFYIYDITGGFKDVTEDSKWVWGST
jgi:hypothetical protein